MTRMLPITVIVLAGACGDDDAPSDVAPDASFAMIDASTLMHDGSLPPHDSGPRPDAGASCELGGSTFPDSAQTLWIDDCNSATCMNGSWLVTAVYCDWQPDSLEECTSKASLTDAQLQIGYLQGDVLFVDINGPICAADGTTKLCRDAELGIDPPSVGVHAVVSGRQSCGDGYGILVKLDKLETAARRQVSSARSLEVRVGSDVRTLAL